MHWTLITGGAQRLGSEIVRMLAKEGRNCVIHFRHSKVQAEQLRDELQALGSNAETLHGDFTTIHSTRAFLDEYQSRFQSTELLVNNVGVYALGDATEPSAEAVQELFQININAALTCIQALLPSLKANHGKILNIGMAGSSLNCANTYATVYNMTKLCLSMLTKSLAKQLAPFNVSVNMVSPGYLENSIDFPKDPKLMPWGRPGTMSEIVEAVKFLISQSYITGQNLEVAGGTCL